MGHVAEHSPLVYIREIAIKGWLRFDLGIQLWYWQTSNVIAYVCGEVLLNDKRDLWYINGTEWVNGKLE